MGWNACALEPNIVLRWMECHPGAAGWSQSIGTLIAIGFAVLAPFVHDWWRERRAHARAKQEVRSLAYDIIAFAAKVESAYQSLDHIKQFARSGHFVERLSVLQETLIKVNWAQIEDHTVFSLGQNITALAVELDGHIALTYTTLQNGAQLLNQNNRVPVVVADCAKRLREEAEAVIRLIGLR